MSIAWCCMISLQFTSVAGAGQSTGVSASGCLHRPRTSTRELKPKNGSFEGFKYCSGQCRASMTERMEDVHA